MTVRLNGTDIAPLVVFVLLFLWIAWTSRRDVRSVQQRETEREQSRQDYQARTKALEGIADELGTIATSIDGFNPADVGDGIARSIDGLADLFGKLPAK